ncbi:MalY/PatB family protein [Methyloversatilis thermotolerans]|uniref:MalY/PatB family protein n=1 Tax=Methyloversatilis thermotolerans TaxID=1346290 RepID=UPI00068661AE
MPLRRDGTASVKHDGRTEVFGTDAVVPLWVADMDFAAPPAVTEALLARARHPVYGYTLYPDAAFDALMRWLAARHGWNVAREHIHFCPGVVPTLYAAVQAFTRPGDLVIVQPPVYPPFFSAVRDTGRRVAENPLIERDGRWTMDFDHLEGCAARAGAKLLLLCSPHNPVGRVWSHEELDRLLEIARRHDLVVLSDEIHADLLYPGVRHVPLATLTRPGDRVLTAVAPSKTFNIPGLGLSALIADDAERKAVEAAFGQLHVGASNPFSLAALEAAYRDGGPWLDALMRYLEATRDEVINTLAHRLPRIHAYAPEGTYLMWLDCRALGLDDAALRDLFVHDAGLGLNAGISFGSGGSGHMRLNLASPRAVIRDALERLRRATAHL